MAGFGDSVLPAMSAAHDLNNNHRALRFKGVIKKKKELRTICR